jgi:hypothetical protein
MNLLARILSHGFALMLVVLIAIALMYRGDLFPEWDLPEFLVIKETPSTGKDAAPANVDSALPKTAVITGEPNEASQVEVIPDVVTEEVLTPGTATDVTAAPPETGTDTGPLNAGVPALDVAPEAYQEETEEEPLKEPVITLPGSSQETEDAAGTYLSGDEPVTLALTPAQGVHSQGEAEVAQAATPVTVTESPVATTQSELPALDEVPLIPLAEPVTEEEPVPAVVDAPPVPSAAVSDSAADAEPPELPAPSVEPATEAKPEPETEATPALAIIPESAVVAEQPEPPVSAVTPSTEATEQASEFEPDPTVTATATAIESKAGKRAYESLAAAREAFWLRDYAEAEGHYRELTEMEPDNPDWYGELGNMYFSQGQWEQAAAAYYEAGVRLLKAGMLEQARQMVNVIRGLNGTGAEDLETQINNVD